MIRDIVASSRDKLLEIFDNLDDEIATIDKNFAIISVNKKMASQLDVHPRSLVNKNYLDLFSGDKEKDTIILKSVFENKEIVKYQANSPDEEGGKKYLQIYVIPLHEGDGEVKSLIVCKRDITDMKLMEISLLESEKLAAIGTMTAGIAHELRNPFTAINMKAQLMLRKPDKYGLNEVTQKTIAEIDNLCCRGNAIVEDILVFSQSLDLNLSDCDPVDIVKSALNLIDFRTDGTDISIEAKSRALINCDKLRIEQVFSNMISNASDAMDGKGKVIVEIDEKPKYVEFRITDFGTGIPPDNLKRIFEPFFTTKSAVKGTGLGLSICQHIVKRHQGYIDLQTELGKGTTFIVGLPKGTRKGRGNPAHAFDEDMD